MCVWLAQTCPNYVRPCLDIILLSALTIHSTRIPSSSKQALRITGELVTVKSTKENQTFTGRDYQNDSTNQNINSMFDHLYEVSQCSWTGIVMIEHA